ncbi:MAG: Bacterial domain [Clostridiales bacterium]|nr:Bacterial domain [Clostridiales bacterium]
MGKKYLMSGVMMFAVFLLGITMGSEVNAGGNSQPGTDYDPLVAKSYVHQEVETRASILQQRIEELQKEVARLQGVVNRLQKQVASGEALTPNINNENTSGDTSGDTNLQNQTQSGFINTKAGANLRTGPGTSYHKITTLPYYTKLRIIAANDGWYQVEVEGKNGWVYGELVSISE